MKNRQHESNSLIWVYGSDYDVIMSLYFRVDLVLPVALSRLNIVYILT